MPAAYQNIGFVGQPPSVASESALGAQDAASRGNIYLVNDFNSAGANIDISTFATGTGNYAGTGPGAVAVNPGELATHPGVCCVQTVAVGYGIVAAYNNSVYATAVSPATYTWNITFRTPGVASNSTDSYKLYVGTSAGLGATYPGLGAGICYTDSQNGGKWQTYTMYPANETEQDTATSVAFVPGVWNNLSVVLAAGKFSFTLNGAALGTLTDGSLTGTTNWQMSAGCINLQRTAIGGTPPTISALIDRSALYISGLGR